MLAASPADPAAGAAVPAAADDIAADLAAGAAGDLAAAADIAAVVYPTDCAGSTGPS